ARRLNRAHKLLARKIEYFDMIDVTDVEPLSLLIVADELEKPRLRKELRALHKLKRSRRCGRPGRSGNADVGLSGSGSRRRRKRDTLQRKGIAESDSSGGIDPPYPRRHSPDFHAHLARVTPKPKPVDLDRVPSCLRSRIRQHLQNLRPIAERVRRQCQPPIRKI